MEVFRFDEEEEQIIAFIEKNGTLCLTKWI
jgi:hypothetical protein